MRGPLVAAAAIVVATSCTAGSRPGVAGTTPLPRRAAGSPTYAAPSIPAGAHLFDGATATIDVPAKLPGNLYIDVWSERAADGTTSVTLRAMRDEDCHLDKADPKAHLYVCTTTFDRRKTLAPGSFTYDGVLGSASLRTAVAGKPLTVTWHADGVARRQENENGALLIENRDARIEARWGNVQVVDRGADTNGTLYRRLAVP